MKKSTNIKVDVDFDEEEELHGVNYKCMDCGSIHKNTGVKHEYIKPSYGGKYISVPRRYCMYCNSFRVSELINKGKNKGLCMIEVMDILCNKE